MSTHDKTSTSTEHGPRAPEPRLTPPRPTPKPRPRLDSLRIADPERGGIVEAPISHAHDRPTPRSTVIPRLPGPVSLPPMRPRLSTLIFHGAPPLPPPTPNGRPSTIFPPPPDEMVLDVNSSELLMIDDDDDRESARPTPFHPPAARTDRPPPRSEPPAPRRERWTWIAAGALVAAAAVVILASSSREQAPPPVAARAVSTSIPPESPVAPATATPPASAPAPAAVPARAPGTCVLAAKSKLLARRAIVRGGIEAASFDDRVAFAALTSNKGGAAFELDAATLAVRDSARLQSAEPLRRVVPSLGDERPVDVLADTGPLRTVPDAEGESGIGTSNGFLVWSPRDGEATARLWRVEWNAQIDAPRVAALGTSGDRAVVFRRGSGVWIGSFRGAQTTSDLTRLSTSALVGAPVIDAHGDEAIVAWAERDGAAAPWGIRWTRWSPHAGTGAVRELVLPPGGPGERAMAPSVAALDAGRFLLAWTEAGHGRNQVRAQVVDASDRPTGAALDVSPVDAVAGQEQIAVADLDGAQKGAIAYLVARRGGFELRATPIECAR